MFSLTVALVMKGASPPNFRCRWWFAVVTKIMLIVVETRNILGRSSTNGRNIDCIVVTGVM